MLIKIISYSVVVLFFWVIYPIKLVKILKAKRIMRERIATAIEKAKQMKGKIYVCRAADEIFFGTAKQMDATQKAIRKYKINWNWTKFILYEGRH